MFGEDTSVSVTPHLTKCQVFESHQLRIFAEFYMSPAQSSRQIAAQGVKKVFCLHVLPSPLPKAVWTIEGLGLSIGGKSPINGFSSGRLQDMQMWLVKGWRKVVFLQILLACVKVVGSSWRWLPI